ncbi:hypothetical protein ABMA27_000062 [Loxostege sticticalis]|uniref:Uncharacterized protein n=1 Tax=Loxostege sticticalis TaxID=481309 RepID=A0ABR3ILZ9_LOXSC
MALMTDCRCIITSTEHTSTLSIHGSTVTDTGIYVVVAKTEYGITSSWSDVVVIEDVKLPDLNDEFEPYIEEMPINTVAYEGEEVKLFCKVRSNYRAEVQWYRKSRNLVIGGRVQETDYGDCYLGLRIQNVVLDDSDKYGIELRDKLNINEDPKVEACRVAVMQEVTVVKPLMSSILTYGSSVTLDCRFDVSRCKHYFMCWYIGHHKVTHTDSRFRVACKHGICLIRILKIEPGMTGEAICQLRSLLSNGTSIVRAFTTCNLAIVPSSVLANEMSLAVRRTPCEIMSGKYSELEDDYYYYLNVTKQINDNKVILMTICECQPDPYEGRLHRIVKIEWDYQGSKSSSDQKVWYRVDYQLPSGHYAPTAITREPQIYFVNPMIDEPAKFRISSVVPDSMTKDAAVSITHRPNEPDGLPEDFEPRPTYKYPEHYQDLTGTMGQGAYGSVCVAKCLLTGTEYAVKTLPLGTFDHRDTCSRELSVLKSLRHPKIVSLVDAYRDDKEAKLVMECLWGKELFERIADSYHVVETDVIPYVRQICDALAYLHDMNVVHLDIKPENIMCVHPNSRQIKLVDFGLARRLNPAYKTMVLNGTRNYVSPEILRVDQLTVKTDMWSVGVVTYMLLSGLPPFLGDNWPEESGKILRAEYNYEDRAFWEVSDLAKDFIDKLLLLDVNRRSSARQAMEHPWLREGPAERPFSNFKSVSTTKLRWQKARFAMIAAQRFRRHRFRHHYARLGIAEGWQSFERP